MRGRQTQASLRPSANFTGDYLKGKDGDRINAILAGAGHNFRLLLNWLRLLFVLILEILTASTGGQQTAAASA